LLIQLNANVSACVYVTYIHVIHSSRYNYYSLCCVDFGFGGTAGASQTAIGGLGGLTGGLATGQQAVDATAAAIAQQNQQQLLQLTNSPYGDSPLFRNLRQVMQFVIRLLCFM